MRLIVSLQSSQITRYCPGVFAVVVMEVISCVGLNVAYELAVFVEDINEAIAGALGVVAYYVGPVVVAIL